MGRQGKRIESDVPSFLRDVLSNLNTTYVVNDSLQVEGQALSYLVKVLRQYEGWRLPGRSDDRRDLFERFGFAIDYGVNARGNRAEVVYYPHPADVSATEIRNDQGEA